MDRIFKKDIIDTDKERLLLMELARSVMVVLYLGMCGFFCVFIHLSYSMLMGTCIRDVWAKRWAM